MTSLHTPGRAFAALLAAAVIWSGCSERSPAADPISPPAFSAAGQQGADAAIAAQERHTAALMRIPGVVGTAVTRLASGDWAVRIFLEHADVPGLPSALDRVPVAPLVTGPFHIIAADPTTGARPAPIGFSVGHPDITAGTIGYRVLRNGNVYILSNNHVLANSNNANVGDATLQPGPADGGTAPDDLIGTLAQFRTILFNGADNTMDAAIALVSNGADLANSTPTSDSYGRPNAQIWGDANGDGRFDDVTDLVGVSVQKYGRTTGHTTGTITAVNASVNVCYAGFIRCRQLAHFVNQLIVGQSGFSAGGDSGSGVVTNDANRHPVGLLFAGSSTQTILNRIDLVLDEFDVTVDGFTSSPPSELTDLEVASVSAAASATLGTAETVTVNVRNTGTTNVGTFNVALHENGATVGTQNVSGLTAGASVGVSFLWTPATTGTRTLAGSHDFTDEVSSNNSAQTTVNVGDGSSDHTHVGAISGNSEAANGGNWRAFVTILAHDAAHAALAGVTVTGSWSGGASGSASCVTDGSGHCTVSTNVNKRQSSVTFTVSGITGAAPYAPGENHASAVTVGRP